MAEAFNKVKVIDRCKVFPPANSVPSTSLPLTFLDIPWLVFSGPALRLFFYEFPSHHYSTNLDFFNQTILSSLKQSLSQTLLHFFPLAGHIVCPSQDSNINPHILYVDADSIPFIVAESCSDFNDLIADSPQGVKEKRQFVPRLPEPCISSEDGTRAIPLMAIQVTIFPERGFSIGLAFHHGVADGISFHHFLKTWAQICTNINGNNFACPEDSLPIHDREVITDPKGVLLHFLNQYRILQAAKIEEASQRLLNDAVATKIRATCTITKAKIESLKKMVSEEFNKNRELQTSRGGTSTFILVCALIWVCLVKSEDYENDKEDVFRHLTYLADCRGRFEFSVPQRYYGNCILGCYVSLKKRQLVGETAILNAVKAIRESITEMENNTLAMAQKWWPADYIGRSLSGPQITVAGSPKLNAYKTDFGWGKPIKSEVVHIDVMTPGISLSESRNGDGGIEVGVALSKAQMESFLSILDHSLTQMETFPLE